MIIVTKLALPYYFIGSVHVTVIDAALLASGSTLTKGSYFSSSFLKVYVFYLFFICLLS